MLWALVVPLLAALAFALVRLAFARAMGVVTIDAAVLRVPDERWVRSPLWARMAHVASGPALAYVVAAAAFGATFRVGGVVADNPGIVHVGVVAGKPAAGAGMQNGDRIVSVDGRPIASFKELSEVVRASADTTLLVVVERSGARLDLEVRVSREGERAVIGVVQQRELRTPTWRETVSFAAPRPVRVLGMIVTALFVRPEPLLHGPKAIVDAMSVEPSKTVAGLTTGAILATYVFVASVAFALALVPWRARRRIGS